MIMKFYIFVSYPFKPNWRKCFCKHSSQEPLKQCCAPGRRVKSPSYLLFFIFLKSLVSLWVMSNPVLCGLDIENKESLFSLSLVRSRCLFVSLALFLSLCEVFEGCTGRSWEGEREHEGKDEDGFPVQASLQLFARHGPRNHGSVTIDVGRWGRLRSNWGKGVVKPSTSQ